MRTAILGDVHGNLEALEAVLAVAAERGVNRYVQVGDVVGYGANPSECLKLLREVGTRIVAGNHDWAVVQKLSADFFNPAARAAVHWTRAQLDKDDIAFLEDLPLVEQIGELTVFHASLDHPELFHYILDPQSALENLDLLPTPLGCCGHSHVPVSFLLSEDNLLITDEEELSFEGYERVIFNVGSVGQPRDGDPRAALAILDEETRSFELIRVPYDLAKTGEKIRRAGLPQELAERLVEGF